MLPHPLISVIAILQYLMTKPGKGCKDDTLYKVFRVRLFLICKSAKGGGVASWVNCWGNSRLPTLREVLKACSLRWIWTNALTVNSRPLYHWAIRDKPLFRLWWKRRGENVTFIVVATMGKISIKPMLVKTVFASPIAPHLPHTRSPQHWASWNDARKEASTSTSFGRRNCLNPFLYNLPPLR